MISPLITSNFLPVYSPIFWELFKIFLQIGLFSFGGGMASLPWIADLLVAKHAWLNQNEFADLLILSQLSPGPIAINAATYVGLKMAGPLASLLATLAGIIAPVSCSLSLAIILKKYGDLKFLKAALIGLRSAGLAFLLMAAGLLLQLVFFPKVTVSKNLNEQALHFLKLGGFSIDGLIFLLLALFIKKKFKPSMIKLMFIMALLYIGYASIFSNFLNFPLTCSTMYYIERGIILWLFQFV